jgi:broad specificity phosphatase PhoE
MRLVLVRHGETTGQSSIRYYGATDVPLSPLGEAQMRCAGAALAGESFDAVVSSRLSRSRRAAALVAGAAGSPRVVAAFDEVDFGHWEGWTRDEIAARDPVNFQSWQSDPEHFQYPGGECRRAFRERVVAGLRVVLVVSTARSIVMVLHRGVIAVVLAELLDLAAAERRALQIDLGSIHVVVRNGQSWRAEILNRIDHLSRVEAAAQLAGGVS